MDIYKEVYVYGKELGKVAGEINRDINPNRPVDEVFAEWEEGIVQDAGFANDILPTIRQLAGCKDPHNAGTFTDCTEEQWEVVNELLDKFWEGASEGFEKGYRGKNLKVKTFP